MSQEDTEELSNLQTDITKTINAKRSDWIMNGFTDADWTSISRVLMHTALRICLQFSRSILMLTMNNTE